MYLANNLFRERKKYNVAISEFFKCEINSISSEMFSPLAKKDDKLTIAHNYRGFDFPEFSFRLTREQSNQKNPICINKRKSASPFIPSSVLK